MRRNDWIISFVIPFVLHSKVVWINPENTKDSRCDSATGYVKPTLHTDTSMEFRSFKVPAPRAVLKDRNGIELAFDTPFPRAAIWLEGGDAVKVKSRFNDDLEILAELLDRKLRDTEIPFKVFEERRGSPIVFNQELSRDEVEKIENKKLPRIRVIQTTKREYPLGRIFSHALGWAMAEESYSDSFLFHAIKGRSGIESLLNSQAAGRNGLIEVLRDAKNFEVKMIFESEATPTPLVELGLDSRLQTKVHEAVASDIKNGVVLIADTQSGEIPVMMSLPTFDPVIFSPFIKKEEYDTYATDIEEPMANKIYRNYGDIVWQQSYACLKYEEDFESALKVASENYASIMGLSSFEATNKNITPLFLLTLLQRLTNSPFLSLTKNVDVKKTPNAEFNSCPDLIGSARRIGSYYSGGENIGLIKSAMYYVGVSGDKRFNIVIFVEDANLNSAKLIEIKNKIEESLKI